MRRGAVLVVVGTALAALAAGDGRAERREENPALTLAALDRKLAELDVEAENDKREVAGLAERIAQAHVRVVAHGKTFYRLTRAGVLPVGGGFDALVQHAMRVERSRRVLAADLARERQLRGRGAELAQRLEQLVRDRSALETQRATLDAARVTTEDEARRQDAFQRAFDTSTAAGGDYVAVYGANAAPVDRDSAGGFHAARGRLVFPVVGRAEVRPTQREGANGPGLEIQAPAGSAVRAVFAGRVAFADRYGAYGRMVILDHGEHYYTVSGNLAGVDVKVGEQIAAGDRVGTVGDEGRGAMLYFEVRHGSQTVTPGPWLGL